VREDHADGRHIIFRVIVDHNCVRYIIFGVTVYHDHVRCKIFGVKADRAHVLYITLGLGVDHEDVHYIILGVTVDHTDITFGVRVDLIDVGCIKICVPGDHANSSQGSEQLTSLSACSVGAVGDDVRLNDCRHEAT
jgi:hypothetical protein